MVRAAAALTFIVTALAVGGVRGDVYMHSPRGANGRNCERNVNRNNGNRLYDTQNNAKGGYACPRAVTASQTDPLMDGKKMYYYVGEKVPLEWTNQHGGGDNGKLHTEVIWQYACTDTLDPTGQFNAADGTVGTPRDGIPQNGNDAATDRIPDNQASATPTATAQKRYGMHESYDYYQDCQRTERNKGLYTADQNVNRRDARGTRQNPNGNRNGLECPEERDYYPYWRPNPWRDIAVISSEYSAEKELYYQQNSQNTNSVGYCKQGTSAAAQADFTQKRNQRRWYNNKATCETANNNNGAFGHTWTAVKYAKDYKPGTAAAEQLKAPQMLVIQGERTRINHLGNSDGGHKSLNADPSIKFKEICSDHTRAATTGRGGCQAAGKIGTGTYVDTDNRVFDDHIREGGQASSFPWTVPDNVNKNCVLRVRYNISTWDFPAFKNGNRYLDDANYKFAGGLSAGTCGTDPDGFPTCNGAAKAIGEPGVNYTYNCRGNTAANGKVCTQVSPVTQDPYIEVMPNKQGAGILSLALNTNQYARTFQDRTYVFEIRKRPDSVARSEVIVAMGVRGKRGNIVQTYPAVEYDFSPSNLVVSKDDRVHFQWVGSDYNPQRGCNNGEGGPPDCQGCTNLAQQIQAGNQNSRADRANIVFMDVAGNNMPRGATGKAVDLYQAHINSQFAPISNAASVWKLAYLDQESEIAARGVSCLTQTQLEAINNKNRRENHPQNCAKLNAARTPYFDAGALKLDNVGKYTAQSTRNNNFSNRDQTLNLCVRTNDGSTGCDPDINSKTGLPKIHVAAPSTGGTGTVIIDGEPVAVGSPEAEALEKETTAPIEKDNDGVGDGESESCEARVETFLKNIGVAGIVAIACAMIALGVVGTLIVQNLRDRNKMGKQGSANTNWMSKEGTDV